jgi:hypothetical protein
MSAIETLMAQVAEYERALGRAVRAVRREDGRTPPWIEDLMVASKDMLNATDELKLIHNVNQAFDEEAVESKPVVARRARPTAM